MGSMFRSEEMTLCQLFIQPEAAYSSISILGEKGIVQFRDLNEEVNSFQRKFVGEVRRCDEMERKLRYIEAEINKDAVRTPELGELPNAPNPREIIDLEARLDRTETEILELSSNYENLQANFLELTELKHVLEKTRVFFNEQAEDVRSPMSDDNAATRGRLGFVAGVVQRERVPAFERMLWRISRGNVFLRQANIETPLEDPKTRNEIFKTVFVAFYQGDELKSRLQKVCAGFHANVYPCPRSTAERDEMKNGVLTRLKDLEMVLNQTQDHRNRVLVTVAKELLAWRVMVRKMKAIYHTLNLFNLDVTKKCLIGECWAPLAELPEIRKALEDGGRTGGSSINSFLNVIETREDPPTYNRTNKFTHGFQVLIDAYGVSTYRELNPALYTIITFPFLFAVMFGDAGHGMILTVFAASMILREKTLMKTKISNEIAAIFFGGRYIVLLMGVFSIYTGLIYNDVFSKSLRIFNSGWSTNYNWSTVESNSLLILNPTDDFNGDPYPFGIDPVWQLAPANKIIYHNSYKMKVSIVFGVLHMIFGITLSVVNHRYFKKSINIIFEFIPQMLFLIMLFGYLVVLVFIKWSLYSAQNGDSIWQGTSCAPSVLILFINMFLFSEAEVKDGCEAYMYEGQSTVQTACIFIALLSIPVMLFGKPIVFLCTRKNEKIDDGEKNNGGVNHGFEMQVSDPEVANVQSQSDHHDDHDEENSFGEVMIHQSIHTIEYVLSTISHTASYLRLWALSLAHAQLSDVLWTMLLQIGLSFSDYTGSIILFFIFAAWASLTVAILVIMEGLSAFLHTLRLHWVEFMSKFFMGTGHPFMPFSFKTTLEEETGDDDY